MTKKKIYTIIDVETTGGRADREKITEIGIVRFDGEKIIETYETLIDPERSIPYNITKITGITQEMVADAPKFYEVAKKIVEMTTGAIFVAHNSRFDYGFIREEFKRLGFTFMRKQLCTVRLSRKAFPGLRSYSLGNLIKHFGFTAERRHRALDDAIATTELFQKILEVENNHQAVDDLVNVGIKESQLPRNISLEKLHSIPEECGVYYFHDSDGDIVYVGKSINIKSRVMQHFANKKNKGTKIQESVHEITWELTGSELVALLHESHEIKSLHPRINRAQRQRNFPWVIYCYVNQEGYICLDIARANARQRMKLDVLYEFPSQLSAKSAMHRIVQQYELCEHFCRTDRTGRPCFYYHLHQCKGACIGEEKAEDYNARVQEASANLGIDFNDDFIIMDKGRNNEEQSIVLIEGGQYRGFGYVSKEDQYHTVNEVKEAITTYQHNRDVVKIIRHYIHKKADQVKIFKLS